MCFRYDVRNLSTDRAIEAFRWLDAGIVHLRLDPNTYWVNQGDDQETSYDHTEVAKTKVGAFENAYNWTETAFTVEDVGAKAVAGRFDMGRELPPEVLSVLERSQIAPETVGTFGGNAAVLDLPPMQNRIRSEGVAISSIASAKVRDGESGRTAVVTVELETVALEAEFDNLNLYAPYILALQALSKGNQPPESLLDAVENFTNELTRARDQQIIISKKIGTFRGELTFPVREEFGLPALFRVEHTLSITDRAEEKIGCFRIPIYSPFPISLQEPYCGGYQR